MEDNCPKDSAHDVMPILLSMLIYGRNWSDIQQNGDTTATSKHETDDIDEDDDDERQFQKVY